MAKIQVVDKELASVELYKELPLILRLDLLPFIFFYSTCFYQIVIQLPGYYKKIKLNNIDGEMIQIEKIIHELSYDDYMHALIVTFLLIGLVQVFTFLLSQWSMRMKFWIGYSKVENIDQATVLKAIPKSDHSPIQLCCIVRKNQSEIGKSNDSIKDHPILDRMPELWFVYQKINFCFCNDQGVFIRLSYPIEKSFGVYHSASGYKNAEEIEMATRRWGKNEFDIPMPKFIELFKEHAVAPFFVFQIFCVLLWCLDEYVYYSILTLFMLVFMECILVFQRQKDMKTLRHMQRPPHFGLVLRMGKWQTIRTDQLVPGDIFSIRRSSNSDSDDGIVPCDLLLLKGSCVVNEAMLSGESIPLRKEAISFDETITLNIDDHGTMEHKRYVIYGGTKVLQQSFSVADEKISRTQISKPSDGGCPCFVLRTGFGTTQGNLMRTILYASERVSQNNPEALMFIFCLLIFATIAAGVVLSHGLQDDTRSRFKLLLHCIMIITSVVPPELPMELTLAVNNSLAALHKLQVFCTEPFRIPYAGKVNVCCFDKTGTLTRDDLVMQGVAELKKSNHIFQITEADVLSDDIQIVLAGCHSLVHLDGKVSGDPLEKEAISKVNWRFNPDDSAVPSHQMNSIAQIRIVLRHSFSSTLKRMSSVVRIENNSSRGIKYRVLTKGAPEVMKDFFTDIPEKYDQVQRHFTSKGCRVLALGYKEINENIEDVRQWNRDRLESQLVFCGLLILDCPLKVDSKKTIKELLYSGHDVKMVTGDNPYTACDVAKQVGINKKSCSTLILIKDTQTKLLKWVSIDDGSNDKVGESFEFSLKNVKDLKNIYNLCVTGPALTSLNGNDNVDLSIVDEKVISQYMKVLIQLCPSISVFARTSPKQKEWILLALNRAGYITSMCGDGTNDVGSLKQAHVGISIINKPELESKMRENFSKHIQVKKNDTPASESTLRKKKVNGSSSKSDKKEAQSKRIEKLTAQLTQEESAFVKFGDASIASPFTSKSPSISVTKDIVRQGRCTLVTTIQMFKILGINCLITAYQLSSLYIQGIKQGDQQLTAFALFISVMFFLISQSKPTESLSKERPLDRVFCVPVILSIVGQFVIHFTCLSYAVTLATPYVDPDEPSMHPDGKFAPNVINTVVFTLGWIMQLNTFVNNYRGHPFMQSFKEHKYLWRLSMISYVVLFTLPWNAIPPLNEALELVQFPDTKIQIQLTAIMSLDTILAYTFEKLVSLL